MKEIISRQLRAIVRILVAMVLSVVFMSGLVFAQADWTQRFPAHVPPKRMNPAMAQSSSGLVVMFGGLNLGAEGRFDQFNVLNDTWVWNGTDWSQIALSSSTS